MRSDIRFNLASAVRHDTLEGRDYFVVPAAQLAEGVWAGSDGPVLYLNEDIEKYASAWDHKPVVVYHPKINGVGTTACDPVILEAQKVGIILNSKLEDGKNRVDVWLEKEKLKKVDPRVYDAVENQKVVEVSTGLYFDLEGKPGKHNDKEYIGVARNYRPDHLAILPDKTGAYSVAAGAGLMQLNEQGSILDTYRNALKAFGINEEKKGVDEITNELRKAIHNEMSHSKTYSYLCTALRAKLEATGKQWYGWIEDVYDTYLIYSADGGQFMIDYTASEEGVKLGKARKVERVIQYQTVDGTPVGNATLPTTNSKEVEMDRKTQIDALIKQNAFAEADRELLMKMEELTFKKIAGAIDNTKKAVENAVKEGLKEIQPKPGMTTNDDTPKPKKKQSFQEYVANELPEEFQEAAAEVLAGHNETKKNLIDAIMNSDAGKKIFTNADELNGMKIKELKRYAAMAKASVPPSENNDRDPTPNYAGQEGGIVANAASTPKRVLTTPTMNFGKEDEKK